MLTVSQLLSWVLAAYDKHDDSFSDVENKHLICKKQALIDLQPKKKVEGFSANEGELELAVALIFSNSYQELAEMREMCYEDPYCEPCDPSPAPPGDTMIRASWSEARSVPQPVPANAYASTPDRAPMTTTEMGAHMAEVLSRPVPPECVMPMDLVIDEREATRVTQNMARIENAYHASQRQA